MSRTLATFILVSLAFSPFSVFAQEAEGEAESAQILPVYFFASEEGQIVALTPISQGIAAVCTIWLATSTEDESTPENSTEPECGVLVLDYGPTTVLENESTGTNAVVTSTFFVHPDHLGSTNVISNASGTAVHVLDYLPYGATRVDQNTSATDQTRQFIGEMYDESSGLNYLNARYYEGSRGQFLSQDPVFWVLPKRLLADPQQMNSYSYGRNNPISNSDPNGLLTVMIPGTWYESGAWTSTNNSFRNAVGATFGEHPVVFNEGTIWSGYNNAASRQEAAQRIAALLNSVNIPEDEKLNIIGHSHGGNVAILVSQLTDHPVDTLVTLGTPARSDYVPANNVGNFISTYSTNDRVQTIGGGITLNRLLGSLIGLLGGLQSALEGYARGSEIGPAGRVPTGATGVDVTSAVGNGPVRSHVEQSSNPDVWHAVEKEIK